jgi:hypothetical protein
MPQLPTDRGGTSLIVARNGNVLTAALEKVPVEAVIKVVDLVAEVVKANKVMESKGQEFEHQFTLLREGNMDRKDRMSMLSHLLMQIEFSEAAQMRLVESICRIAEGG